MDEHRAAFFDDLRPPRLLPCIEVLEELVRLAVADPFRRNSRQHHPIRSYVGTVRVVGIDVYESVPRACVIAPEIQKRRRAETGGKPPVAPRPARAVIARPRE